jgi:hypothetical protein
MKSLSSSREYGNVDEEKIKLINEPSGDPMRFPLIEQRETSPIRFEEQIEKLIPEELNVDIKT